MKSWLPLLMVILLISCGGKDSYHYPSVKEEFFSAYANADSLLQYIITDDGVTRQVVEPRGLNAVAPDSLVRLMGYYEEQTDGKVKVHSFLNAISPLPVPAEQYADSVATAPVVIQSSWLGYQHVNMLVNVKAGGKTHKIVFLEESSEGPDADGVATAVVSIHHNDAEDARVYDTRGYASLPLTPYLTPQVRKLNLVIRYLTYEEVFREIPFVYINTDR